MKIQAVLGTWEYVNGVLTGVLGSSGLNWGYCLAGNPTDKNYRIKANVTLASGNKVSIIVAFTYDASWNPIFAECILDVQNQTLHIDLVDATQRITVAQRAFALSLNAVYPVAVKLYTGSDGYPIIGFYVNDVVQLTIGELSQLYAQGQMGFGIWGPLLTNSAVFSDVAWESLVVPGEQPETFISAEDVAAQLNATGPDASGNYTVYGLTLTIASLKAHVKYANIYVTGLLGAVITSTDPRYASAVVAATDLACIRALVISMGGSLIGAYDYSLGDLRMNRAGPYATAIKSTIEGLKEDLVRQLVNLTTVVKTANAKAAGEVPTYRGGLISP